MAPLEYAALHLTLLVVAFAAALFAWRAAYRAYNDYKRKRDAAAAVERIEEQRRRIAEYRNTTKDD